MDRRKKTREDRRMARKNLTGGLLFGAIILLIPVYAALVDVVTDTILF